MMQTAQKQLHNDLVARTSVQGDLFLSLTDAVKQSVKKDLTRGIVMVHARLYNIIILDLQLPKGGGENESLKYF